MTTTTIKSERTHVEQAGVVPMDLPADEAFRLYDPEGERRWVEGWDPTYVHPSEPAVREGVVFQTMTGEGEATWMQTRYDPATRAASYVYIVPDHRATMVDVGISEPEKGRSQAHVRYRMTALSPEADDFVQAFGDGFGDYLVRWEAAVQKHIVDGVPLGSRVSPTY